MENNIEEKVTFKNSKEEHLSGLLVNPSNDNDKLIVILCHGLSSHKNSSTQSVLKDLLASNNISTLRFDFWGHGESAGKFEEVTVTEAIDDILQAYKFLKHKKYIKIGLIGASFGGSASIFAAHELPDLKFLGLKSPVSTWEGLKKDYTFHDDAIKYDGYKVASEIKIPVQIVHGTADQSVPVEQSQKIAKLFPHCKLEIIEGADHQYTNEAHFHHMIQTLFNFIKSH